MSLRHFREQPGNRPMSWIRGLSSPYRIVAIGTLCIGVFVTAGLLQALLAEGIPTDLASKDFANYWMAGRLIDSGQAADLFGPQPAYFAHLQRVFGSGYGWHNWSYPPHVLLLLWPLGFLGYKAAAVTFLVVTGGFFVWSLRVLTGRVVWMALVATGALVVHNISVVQNGFLTAGLGLSALALREKRPVLAGIMLGFMTIKPQLGLLFPFLLLAERRWTMLASATVTTVTLVIISAAIFGIDAWEGYFREVVPYQAFVMREMQGSFLAMMPSVYGTLRNWGLGPDIALSLHSAVALPVAAIAIAAFFRVENPGKRTVILLVATFVITPYVLSYDLGLFAAALAMMAGDGRKDDGASRGVTVVLALAMLLPVIMTPLGGMKLSVAPVVILCVLFMALRRTGFTRASRLLSVGQS